MRTVNVTLRGQVYAMPVSFAAIPELAEKVGDPFKIAAGMTRGEMLTLAQTIETVIVGARLAGCQLERDDIGQEIIDTGAQDYLAVASRYLIDVVSGGPAIPSTSKKKQGKRP